MVIGAAEGDKGRGGIYLNSSETPCLIFCASSGKGTFPAVIRFGMFATS